jgi:hypothetical protein
MSGCVPCFFLTKDKGTEPSVPAALTALIAPRQSVQANRPFSNRVMIGYFEVTIVSAGQRGCAPLPKCQLASV